MKNKIVICIKLVIPASVCWCRYLQKSSITFGSIGNSTGKAIPLQALRVPGVGGSQTSRQSAREGGKAVSSTHQPSLHPRKYSWYSFLLGRKDYVHEKNPLTTSGIEPVTFHLVAQCLNELLHRLPHRSRNCSRSSSSSSNYYHELKPQPRHGYFTPQIAFLFNRDSASGIRWVITRGCW